jgi:type I restriction enzyme S subunit
MLSQMFPKEGECTPKLRFKGFSGEWEENKLGEYAKFRRGSFPQPYGNKEWYDGEGSMPFVQVVDVTSNLALVKNTKQKISLIAQPKSVFVEQGSVVVTLQGSIGRVAILQYNAYLDRTLLIFEEFKNATNTYFWAYIIQELFEIEKKKAPGGTIKTITKDALSSFKIFIPNLIEQTKIGNYFQKLDTLIDLHQKELEKLKNMKKALLAKMFV